MAIKLKDMKITRSEAAELKQTVISPPQEEFPFGLSLHLNEDVIEKLGLDKLPVPGAEGAIIGKVMVESASISKDKDKQRRSLTLQITKLGFEVGAEKVEEDVTKEAGPPKPSAAEVLFSD